MRAIKILVMGLPGSGKTFLSERLSKEIKSKWVNADIVRKEANDWDFSLEGRIRQAKRIKKISDKFIKKGNNCLTDFVCPTKKTRKEFNADYVIWMDTIDEGRFDDTNKLFEKPTDKEVNYIVKEKNADKYKIIIAEKIKEFINYYNKQKKQQ